MNGPAEDPTLRGAPSPIAAKGRTTDKDEPPPTERVAMDRIRDRPDPSGLLDSEEFEAVKGDVPELARPVGC